MMRNWIIASLLAVAVGCSPSQNGEPGERETTAPNLREVDYTAPEPVVFRLTRQQYVSAVHDAFHSDVSVPARFEPDVRDNGSLVLGAAKTTVSPRGVELYEEAAMSIGNQLMAEPLRSEVLECEPSGVTDPECAELFIRAKGRLLWRRPLDSGEIERLVAVADEAATTLGDFHQGLALAVSALLQSPHFLFRKEIGSSDGGARRLTDFELASRLSFFLWNTIPDDELLSAAEAGELSMPEVLERQVDRMLADERAQQGVRTFFSDTYELDRLDDLVKAPEIFEHASEDVGPSAREETLRTIEWLVFERGGDFRDILTTRTTFLNRKLASIYGVRAPARDGFAMHVHEAESPRAGLLGQTSFLALAAHPTSTSPTLRGKFIRQKLLCHLIPPPPAGVDTSIPEPSGEAPTLRARVQEHLTDPACSSCHQITDPIGLGYENFDGIGRYRERDNGVVIDPSGDLDGATFADAAELGELLAEHPDVPRCVTTKLYAYATGHEVSISGQNMVRALAERWAANDYDFLKLMRDVALSPAFRELHVDEVTP